VYEWKEHDEYVELFMNIYGLTSSTICLYTEISALRRM